VSLGELHGEVRGYTTKIALPGGRAWKEWFVFWVPSEEMKFACGLETVVELTIKK
jgi:hypothetical protein